MSLDRISNEPLTLGRAGRDHQLLGRASRDHSSFDQTNADHLPLDRISRDRPSLSRRSRDQSSLGLVGRETVDSFSQGLSGRDAGWPADSSLLPPGNAGTLSLAPRGRSRVGRDPAWVESSLLTPSVNEESLNPVQRTRGRSRLGSRSRSDLGRSRGSLGRRRRPTSRTSVSSLSGFPRSRSSVRRTNIGGSSSRRLSRGRSRVRTDAALRDSITISRGNSRAFEQAVPVSQTGEQQTTKELIQDIHLLLNLMGPSALQDGNGEQSSGSMGVQGTMHSPSNLQGSGDLATNPGHSPSVLNALIPQTGGVGSVPMKDPHFGQLNINDAIINNVAKSPALQGAVIKAGLPTTQATARVTTPASPPNAVEALKQVLGNNIPKSVASRIVKEILPSELQHLALGANTAPVANTLAGTITLDGQSQPLPAGATKRISITSTANGPKTVITSVAQPARQVIMAVTEEPPEIDEIILREMLRKMRG